MATAIIVGIRSHFVKLAGLSLAVPDAGDAGELVIVRAGQHYDWELSDQYIDEYNLRIDVDLTPDNPDARPHFLLGTMLGELEEWLRTRRDVDAVAVFGDANASLAGAIAGRRAGRGVIHIEAGLRTDDEVNPEELNRRLIDCASHLHLASCDKDFMNLHREAYGNSSYFTGDVVKDLVFKRHEHLPAHGGLVLICIHRKENIHDNALAEAAVQAVLDVNLTPVVLGHPAAMMHLRSLGHRLGIEVHGSLGHKRTLELLNACRFGITDSGALQREAYYLDRRLLVRQDHPFWSTLVEQGFHRQVGRLRDDLSDGIDWALRQPSVPREELTEFGDGRAGKRILEYIAQFCSQRSARA